MKSENIFAGRDTVVILSIWLDNFYAFKEFQLNLTYPKKIVGSCIQNEYLEGFPNFRYKKVNIIMGANASGKTTLGHILMNIFNFIHHKSIAFIKDGINDRTQKASFMIDFVCRSNVLYRICCDISPKPDENYSTEDVNVSVRKEKIRLNDSYSSCITRLESAAYTPCKTYLEELEQVEQLAWLFEYPQDANRTLKFYSDDKKFPLVLEHILKALDPSIQEVEASTEVPDAFVVRFRDRAVILQNGAAFNDNLLSSGTKAGVEVARVVSALLQGRNSFYYCDEKFSYIHSDVEKAILSIMIDAIHPNEQLFFTTHNTDILEMNLPKHSFTFLRKNPDDIEHPISCICASDLLKRNSDSLKNAVENDMFSTAPAVELIYNIVGS